jgi:hypothetical protein
MLKLAAGLINNELLKENYSFFKVDHHLILA